MKRKPMFRPNGDGYDMNLAGVLLLCGDCVYGNPAETTPQGRENAEATITRILAAATAGGFRMADTLLALLRRNVGSPRLINLAQEATDHISAPLQNQIIREINATADVAPVVEQTQALHNGVDVRFWEAGYELQRIAEVEGSEAVHKPEHAHLYATLFKYAPEPLKTQMRDKAEEMGLMPKATHVNEQGEPVFSLQQIADTHGVDVAEVESALRKAAIEPGDTYIGPVHPLQ